MAQKVFFDPNKPFERRLLKAGQPAAATTIMQPDYMKIAQEDDDVKDVIQHSTKRIKKKIIDYILNNYKSLFFA